MLCDWNITVNDIGEDIEYLNSSISNERREVEIPGKLSRRAFSKKPIGNVYYYKHQKLGLLDYDMKKNEQTKTLCSWFLGHAILKDYETAINVIIFGAVAVYAFFYLLFPSKKVIKYYVVIAFTFIRYIIWLQLISDLLII